MWFEKFVLMDEEAGDASTGAAASGGGGDVAATGADATASAATAGTVAADTATGTQSAGDDKGSTSPWPANWRELYAGQDEKKLARLSRYASPQAAIDAMIAAQNRISSGELKAALPKDATPEQVAQWRADNGVPEGADKYDLTFDNGLVIGENDKPIIDGFLKALHGANMSNAQAKAAVQWYYDFQKEQTQVASENAKVAVQQTEDKLRSEWGNDYRGNVNAIGGMLDSFLPTDDPNLRTLVENGIKQNAGFAKMMANVALQLNPAGSLIGYHGGDMGKTIDGRIKEIEETMRTDRAKYNRDGDMQEELRRLYTAREANRAKAA